MSSLYLPPSEQQPQNNNGDSNNKNTVIVGQHSPVTSSSSLPKNKNNHDHDNGDEDEDNDGVHQKEEDYDATKNMKKNKKMMKKKIIYLIRHAESDENRRRNCLHRAFDDIKCFRLPNNDDIINGIEWFQLSKQIDSNVSEHGQKQLLYMKELLITNDFINKHHIQLIAHSPLKRARDTSYIMLGYRATDTATSTTAAGTAAATADVDSTRITRATVTAASSSSSSSKEPTGTTISIMPSSLASLTITNTAATAATASTSSATTATDATSTTATTTSIFPSMPMIPPPLPPRVVELDLLKEVTIKEVVTLLIDYRKRIDDLESWLEQQDETNIILVGHSYLFKDMLQLKHRFHNCDIHRIEFYPYRTKKQKRIQEKQKQYDEDDDSNHYGDDEDENHRSDKLPAKWSNLKRIHICSLPQDEEVEKAGAT